MRRYAQTPVWVTLISTSPFLPGGRRQFQRFPVVYREHMQRRRVIHLSLFLNMVINFSYLKIPGTNQFNHVVDRFGSLRGCTVISVKRFPDMAFKHFCHQPVSRPERAAICWSMHGIRHHFLGDRSRASICPRIRRTRVRTFSSLPERRAFRASSSARNILWGVCYASMHTPL